MLRVRDGMVKLRSDELRMFGARPHYQVHRNGRRQFHPGQDPPVKPARTPYEHHLIHDEESPSVPEELERKKRALPHVPSLEISPPKFQKKGKNPGSEIIGEAPFRQAIVGPSGSGKSVLLKHLMEEFFKDYFDLIYWWSPTFPTDPSFQPRTWEPTQVFTQFDSAMLWKIYKLQRRAYREKHRGQIRPPKASESTQAQTLQYLRQSQSGKGRAYRSELETLMGVEPPKPKTFTRSSKDGVGDDSEEEEEGVGDQTELKVKPRGKPILLVMDDFASEQEVMEDPTWAKISFHGRHFDISVITLTQKYLKMSKTNRVNLTQLYLFRPDNMAEARDLADEQGCALFSKRGQFNKMYADVVQHSPHDFLFINKRTPNMCDMYRHNLNRPLKIDQWLDSTTLAHGERH